MNRRIVVTVLMSAALGAPSMVAAQYSWGRPSEPQSGACFYKDPEFHGDYFCVRDGENQPDMPRGLNDKISSVRIFGNASVTVFQDSRFEGRSSRFDYDVPDLKREGWNDSHLVVPCGGRLGPPARARQRTRQRERLRQRQWQWKRDHGNGYGNPDQIIKRAYEDVLNREPDPEGLRVYRRHIVDDGWTEQQVRQSLRASPEDPAAEHDDVQQGAGNRAAGVPERPAPRARRRRERLREQRAEQAHDAGRRRERAAEERLNIGSGNAGSGVPGSGVPGFLGSGGSGFRGCARRARLQSRHHCRAGLQACITTVEPAASSQPAPRAFVS